jgi:DNA primase
LIQALLKCSWDEAERLSGTKTTIISVGDYTFGSYISSMMNRNTMPQENNTALEFPREIKPVTTHIGIQYLMLRKYSRSEASELSSLYHLREALIGPFAWRLVIPVFDEYGLATWTGRAIGKSAIKYRTLSDDAKIAKSHGLPQARKSIKDCLLNYDQLCRISFDTLILCEGPFDGLRIDYYGRKNSIRGSCLFGKSISDEQANALERLRHRFNNLWLALDSDADMDLIRTAQKLAHLDVKTKLLPPRVADPDSLSRPLFREWVG